MGKAKQTNEEVLRKGLQKAGAMIIMGIVNKLVPLCKELLAMAEENNNITGFTGQTQTSYMCLIYIDASVSAMVSDGGIRMFQPAKQFIRQSKYKKPPVRVKVPEGSRVYLEHPYEGKKRNVYGMVSVNNLSGEETSKKQLEEYEIKRNHIAIVMTTGTEYSEYLEDLHHYDVLTNTFVGAYPVLKSTLLLSGPVSGSYFNQRTSRWFDPSLRPAK